MVFRYRDRGQRAHFTRGHTWMEITWTVVTLATFLGLGIAGNRVWAGLEISPSSANPIQVEVTESHSVTPSAIRGLTGNSAASRRV